MRPPNFLTRARIVGIAVFAAFAAYPLLPFADPVLGGQFIPLFIYVILALALNVVVGYTGLLHLGIAAFFGIGAYATGILASRSGPFQLDFLSVLAISFGSGASIGVLTTAPTLRLRGDYFALVTLGFGIIATYLILNFDEITAGSQGIAQLYLSPVPGATYRGANVALGGRSDWQGFPAFYYVCLAILAVAFLVLGWIERSRLGRSWVAMREDELAAACTGLDPARLKLLAIAIGAGLAGLAGCLYAVALKTTAGPEAYTFNRSMIALCCLILGGIGNRPGVVLGVLLLIGFDNIITPKIDSWIQDQLGAELKGKSFYKLSGWKLIIFGMVLILMMRFRPAGLLPEVRHQHELKPQEGAA